MLHAVVHGKYSLWEGHCPLVKFPYNRVIHSTIGTSPFQVLYGFNPLTPLYLTPLSQDVVLRLDGSKRADAMKKIHEKVWMRLDTKYHEVTKRFHKGRKKISFEMGDWELVHSQGAIPHPSQDEADATR